MASVMLVTLIFCVCLRQYKLLVKVVALVLVLIAINGMLDPGGLNRKLGDMKDAMLYKGHKEEGLMGSRKTPWEKTKASIKGVSVVRNGIWHGSDGGEDPGSGFWDCPSTAETAREHGNSYLAIAEWVGLLGVAPFVAILAVTVSNVGPKVREARTCGPNPPQAVAPVSASAAANKVRTACRSGR